MNECNCVTRIARKLPSYLALLVVCVLVNTGSALAQSDGGQEVQNDLLAGLQEGGYVIYFRHSITEMKKETWDEVDLDQCETQRNLSQSGRSQAQRIGEAFRKLQIPVGQVLASPFCRCLETARLAFGDAVEEPGLRFWLPGDEHADELAHSLADLLGSPPRSGNRVLVSHRSNLRKVAGMDPQPEGIAIVFRPGPEGAFSHVATIHPQAWLTWAGIKD